MRTSALFTIVIVSTSLFLTLSSNAQNSQVKWSSFAVGFGLPSSENSAATSSAGESFAGTSTNENSKVVSGFLSYSTSITTGIADEKNLIPVIFDLHQNYPNPFNPSTVISWQLPVSSRVSLKVYDVLGKEVATLVNENKEAGYYETRFDGSALASGLYIYRLSAGNFVSTKKMLMIK
jgi:hypothetical protein